MRGYRGAPGAATAISGPRAGYAARAAQEDAYKLQQEAQLTFSNRVGHGVAEKRPEDSVYYHPTLNPEGQPPPGKPQARRFPLSCMAPI